LKHSLCYFNKWNLIEKHHHSILYDNAKDLYREDICLINRTFSLEEFDEAFL